jgi:hypothetical protein
MKFRANLVWWFCMLALPNATELNEPDEAELPKSQAKIKLKDLNR